MGLLPHKPKRVQVDLGLSSYEPNQCAIGFTNTASYCKTPRTDIKCSRCSSPRIANQPKVITQSQASSPDGPKGPRDGRWYASIFGGAMVEQFQVNATSTAIGQQPLDQGPSRNLGSYAGFKVGYDFAVRDVQLAFGGPTPMRTSMELEGSYLGTYEKIPLYNVSTGGPTVGYEPTT